MGAQVRVTLQVVDLENIKKLLRYAKVQAEEQNQPRILGLVEAVMFALDIPKEDI